KPRRNAKTLCLYLYSTLMQNGPKERGRGDLAGRKRMQFLGLDRGHRFRRRIVCSPIGPLLVSGCIAVVLSGVHISARQSKEAPSTLQAARAAFDKYCVTCHNQTLRTGGLELDRLDLTNPSLHAEVWERVIAKLRAGSMPPPGVPRPTAAGYDAMAGWL